MKSLCIFAHWDRDKIIDDYVIYYIKALKEVCETIIFVSDCNLEASETSKLDNIADFVLAQKHGEYDFGSYKRGFLFAKEKGLDLPEVTKAKVKLAKNQTLGSLPPVKNNLDVNKLPSIPFSSSPNVLHNARPIAGPATAPVRPPKIEPNNPSSIGILFSFAF